jgi:hypothetical protein
MTQRCPNCNKESELQDDPCCKNRRGSQWCVPDSNREPDHEGCESYKFLFERDHAYLNTDVGLYLNFGTREHGFPSGCEGLDGREAFSSRNVLEQRRPNAPKIQTGHTQHRWAFQNCGKQNHREPRNAAQTLSEMVEEFARDQTAWLNAYIPAMEKYLSNGYDDLVDVLD